MKVYKACKYYLEGGECSHKDAPVPCTSKCIGQDACGVWEDKAETGSYSPSGGHAAPDAA